MEQNSLWEANSHLLSQEISRLLWNLNVNYRTYKSPPLDPILSQMNPNHTLSSYFFKIRSKLFSYLSTCLLSNLSLQISRQELSYACYIPNPFNYPWIYQHNNAWRRLLYLSQDISELRWPLQIHELMSSQPRDGEGGEATAHKASYSSLALSIFPSPLTVAQVRLADILRPV
jgi:hypothetical protein